MAGHRNVTRITPDMMYAQERRSSGGRRSQSGDEDVGEGLPPPTTRTPLLKAQIESRATATPTVRITAAEPNRMRLMSHVVNDLPYSPAHAPIATINAALRFSQVAQRLLLLLLHRPPSQFTGPEYPAASFCFTTDFFFYESPVVETLRFQSRSRNVRKKIRQHVFVA